MKWQFQPVCISRNTSALCGRSESTIFPVVRLREDRFGITAILLTKNWRPSLCCLLLPCTDDFVLPLTFLHPPFPFSDPLVSENPAHAMGYLQVVYKETQAVVSRNVQYAHATTCCCQTVRSLLLLCSLAGFTCAYSCLSDPSLSWFKSLKLSKSLHFIWICFLTLHELVQLLQGPFKWQARWMNRDLLDRAEESHRLGQPSKKLFWNKMTAKTHLPRCWATAILCWSHFCSGAGATGDA